MEKRLSISLSMIVKNEEKWLERCLNSVIDIVDEIVIVDTGSTDKTKEICTSFPVKLYDYDWNDSFADARNFGLSKVNGDWILYIDADEELYIEDINRFHNVLQQTKNNVVLIPTINYYGNFPPDSNKAYLYASHRLFRNHKGFKFVGNIHEHLNIVDISDLNSPEIMSFAKIHHYGYMDSVVEDKNKSVRNLSLLQKEKEASDYSPWIDYHIASEYYREECYEKAFDLVNLSIKRFIEKKQLPPALLYKLKYDILITLGSFDGAWPGIEKAITMYPKYVDLHFYKGIIFMAQKKYEEAISVFYHCIKLGEEHNPLFLTKTGNGSYQSWYLIGRCYEGLDNPVKARKAYRQSLALYPDYEEAKLRMRKPDVDS
ncbi:glycosyltransferase [Proteiniborus sp. MB09-C3]|uniref:glycosyltransferase n=1 Tax=Proteiniborus sp. MB09-C3 TaxID=3050072 RepID=UPI002557343B|nr:glycosyltransferase [Proteiniborus sp. MB09-C3]WIV13784.1 glycosyltransferase [Proteiniborus sp. MB09-C3]